MCPTEPLVLQRRQQRQKQQTGLRHTDSNDSTDTLISTDTSDDDKSTDNKATVKDVVAGELEPLVTQVLQSAPPPWHSVTLIACIALYFVHRLPSWEQLDEVATIATFCHYEPWIGSVWALGLCRLIVAISIWGTTWHVVSGPGWTVFTKFKPASKLKRNTAITLKGVKTLFPFTSWSWNLLGFSYLLNGVMALSVAIFGKEGAWWLHDLIPNNGLLRLALIVWETAAPCAILVSTVIRYAIWEMVLHSKDGNTDGLKSFRNMMMHNANSVYVLLEVALLGGLPVRFEEISLAPLFGVCYVLFTWFMTHRWTDPEHGPQFIYYFMDTTMGKVTSISLLALLCALLVFYFLFATAHIGLDQLSNYSNKYVAVGISEQQENNADATVPSSPVLLVGHVCFVTAIASLVCRFRD